jgi:glycosyltransferase involved in cell wall biosynthesis
MQPRISIVKRRWANCSNCTLNSNKNAIDELDSMDHEARRTISIVSVTPLAVLTDSRTFKQATSFSRFGYVSTVVEGEESQEIKTDLKFRLQSIKKKGIRNEMSFAKDDKAFQKGTKDQSSRIKKRIMNQCKDLLSRIFINPLRFGLFFCLFTYRYGLVPLASIPRASLYYLHSPYQFLAVFLLSRWYRVPYIYDSHDFYLRIEEERELPGFQKRWIQPFHRRMEAQCIRHAAAVVTVSKGIAELQRRTFECRSTVIRNCHDPRLDLESIQSVRKYLNLNEEAFLLVMIGQAKKGQAIKEALDAMLELPEFVHLVFLGKNYDFYNEAVRSREMEKRVHFVAPVHPYEVVPFLRTADASLIPYYSRSVNYFYCLPNGLFQAIEAELPLLYPDLPEISRIAKVHELGIPIDPKCPRSVSQAVRRLLGNPEERARYRKNLRRVKGILSWEVEEKVLEELVEGVLKQRN